MWCNIIISLIIAWIVGLVLLTLFYRVCTRSILWAQIAIVFSAGSAVDGVSSTVTDWNLWVLRGPLPRHYESEKCRLGDEQRRRWENLHNVFEASQVNISVNAEPLEPTADLPYLGRTVAFKNSDWAALYHNLRKSRRRWEVAAKVLTRTGVTVWGRVMLYKAEVKTILLYWSEIWVVTGSMLKVLEGFHHQVAIRIEGKTARCTVGV